MAEDEEVVYDRLGMAWVPPVLREDLARSTPPAGPAGAGRRGRRGGDFHCHTDLSPDGTALETMVDAARARGYRFLAITDHGEAPRRGQPQQLLAQRERIRARAAPRRHQLLHGAELNIGGDGSLDYDDEFLDGFDVLVASVHDRLDQPREPLTARLVAACEHPAVNVIGHPTGRRIGAAPPATSTWRPVPGGRPHRHGAGGQRLPPPPRPGRRAGPPGPPVRGHARLRRRQPRPRPPGQHALRRRHRRPRLDHPDRVINTLPGRPPHVPRQGLPDR